MNLLNKFGTYKKNSSDNNGFRRLKETGIFHSLSLDSYNNIETNVYEGCLLPKTNQNSHQKVL